MDTIEIQCGSCNQTMGVLVEHLGTQVHCPHCDSVVQTPSADSFAAPSEAAEKEHGESIFAEPDRDDVLDSEVEQPRIHIPEKESEGLHASNAPTEELTRLPDLSLEKRRFEEPDAPRSERRAPAADAAATHDLGFHGESAAVTQAVKPRKRSLLVPTLLIFLVPYSIVATIFVVMLVVERNKRTAQEDPMQRIPDPEPAPKGKKGPPRQITRHQHDGPLPSHLVTTLRTPVRVGDIEVTPLEVRQTAAGNLALRFKARNLAPAHAFVPVSPSFLKVSDKLEIAKPYTFLHSKDLTKRIYGGFVEYQNQDGEPDLNSDGELLPGEEQVVQISTLDRFNIPTGSLLRSGQRCVWRIQVRRGLVEVEGQAERLSATAVIGVEFAPAEVIRDRKGT